LILRSGLSLSHLRCQTGLTHPEDNALRPRVFQGALRSESLSEPNSALTHNRTPGEALWFAAARPTIRSPSRGRAVVREEPFLEGAHDQIGNVVGFVGGVDEDVPPIDVGARELPVHVARRSFVPEPVALPRTNPLDAAVNRRQEHYVREVIQAVAFRNVGRNHGPTIPS
jgi:hypothetical protein